jgi:hypothetical protein
MPGAPSLTSTNTPSDLQICRAPCPVLSGSQRPSSTVHGKYAEKSAGPVAS